MMFLRSIIVFFSIMISNTVFDNLALYYDGFAIDENAVIILKYRSEVEPFASGNVNEIDISFEVNVPGKTKILVSEGTLASYDEETSQFVYIGTEITLLQDSQILWNLFGAASKISYISLISGGTQLNYVLFLGNDGNYRIQMVKK